MRAAGSHRQTQNIRVSLAVAQVTRTSKCALASRDTAAGAACHALAFLRDMHHTRACQCCPPVLPWPERAWPQRAGASILRPPGVVRVGAGLSVRR